MRQSAYGKLESFFIPVSQDKRKLRKLLGQQGSQTSNARRKVTSYPDAIAPDASIQTRFKPVSFASAWRELDTIGTTENQGPIHRHEILDTRCRAPLSSRPSSADMGDTIPQRISYESRQSFGGDGRWSEAGNANSNSYASQGQRPYHGRKDPQSPLLSKNLERVESVSQTVSQGRLQRRLSSNVSMNTPYSVLGVQGCQPLQEPQRDNPSWISTGHILEHNFSPLDHPAATFTQKSNPRAALKIVGIEPRLLGKKIPLSVIPS